MPLFSGTRLGRYEIRTQIGAGGMGEVYLAEDTQLRRSVALKLLPSDVSQNHDRLRRFEQEAFAVAALNHPNIAHIYEIGEADGAKFIAMEYVEGETLREKIHRDRVDLRTLLKYLAQVADGLAKAHAAGIVHRDLKPDNIMISRDGFAKILDFGLAKLTEMRNADFGMRNEEAGTLIQSPENNPQSAIPNPQSTAPGMIMGTVNYMSPEQARGQTKEIDQRSDIFSFGSVLYEAVTGQQPFSGDSLVDTLHKIIYAPAPPVRDLNAAAPNDLQRIVRRCLQKDPEERYQTIKDVAIELKELRREMKTEAELHYPVPPPTQNVSHASQTKTPTSFASTAGQAVETKDSSAARSTSSAEYLAVEIKRHQRGAIIAVALLALISAGIGYGIYRYSANGKKTAPPLSAMKLARLTTSGKATAAAISPDGRYVVYAVNDNGQQSLWMRQTATQSNVQIVPPAADVNYARLMFSPDGDYLFYTAAAERNVDTATLYQIPVLGGTPKKLLSNVSSFMALSPDASQVVFKREFSAEGIDTLMLANVDGTNERRLAIRKMPERSFEVGGTQSAPAWSPDGKIIACKVTNVDGGVVHNSVATIDAASGQETLITAQKFYSMGQLAWLNDKSGLLMLAADGLGGAAQLWHLPYPEGEARRVTNDFNNYRTISLTADSKNLVTVQFQRTSSIWIAPPHDVARAKQITSGAGRDDYTLRWTPDHKIVFVSSAGGERLISVMEADGSNQKQLTTEGGTASVSRDGSRIVFPSIRAGASHIFRMDADGGNVKQLTNGSGEFVPSFSPDGKWVLYNSRESGMISLWRVPMDGGTPQQLTKSHSYNISVSPDGKWLTANYREDAPNSPDKVAVFPFEGGQPVKIFDHIPTREQRIYWTPDSRALIYIVTRGGVSNLWTQPLDGGAPKQITDFKADRIFSFDYSRDGKQLALARGTVNNDVVLISNFK